MSASLIHFKKRQNFQELTHSTRFTVAEASTAAGTLASDFEAGDTLGSITLSTNDIILIKDQVDASENGVYVVQASGAPVRHASYDTIEELNTAHIYVSGSSFVGGANVNTVWFQNNTLISIASDQSWSNTPNQFSFTVPGGVHELSVIACGGGGGGGAGSAGNNGLNQTGVGGGGGAASPRKEILLQVSPGDVLNIDLGYGGKSTAAGTSTIITNATASEVYTFVGANGGAVGLSGTQSAGSGTPGAAGDALIDLDFVEYQAIAGQIGGTVGNAGASSAAKGILGDFTTPGGSALGTTGYGGGGGAGAHSFFGKGGDGGNGGAVGTDNAEAGENAPNYGAGGGGGGGGGEAGSPIFVGGFGGSGGDGYLKLIW